MDAVTIAVVRGALDQVADEMNVHLIRSALSPVISEMNDCATGIYDARNGETIAQGQFGLPLFLANMQLMVQALMPIVEREGGFREGDVWVLNDPYVSGTHLPDAKMLAPFFYRGQLVALLAATGHLRDIGGMTPGGFPPSSTSIHQEGLIIPPVRLVRGGELDQSMLRLICANLRMPDDVRGDLLAMRNVFAVGAARLNAVLDRYGADVVAAATAEMMERSEQQMRSYIRELPNGVYRFEDFLDNDGLIDEPIRFVLKLTAQDGELEFDFTGTAPTSKGPFNLPRSTTISACYVTIKHIFHDVPVNGGAFRPIRFVIPEGSALSACYPDPVSGYLEMVGRVVDLSLGALVQGIPKRVPAAFFGTTGNSNIGGVHPRTGRFFVGGFPYPGGYGGSLESDGLVHAVSPQSMAMLMSFELCEHRYPIRFRHVKLREDSGGAGWHSGGAGSSISFTALSNMVYNVLGDRVDHPPFGVLGGQPGAPNQVRFCTAGREWAPPLRSKYQGLELQPGDWVEMSSPGGGGYGDPLTRDIASVERDLNRGVVSLERARREFGVELQSTTEIGGRLRYRLDEPASERLRAARLGTRKANAPGAS